MKLFRRDRVKVGVVKRLRNRLKRIRHRKGYGVHSPYVYTLIRDVFSKRVCNEQISSQLQGLTIKRRELVEIANFITHTKALNFGVDVESIDGYDLVICSKEHPLERIDLLIDESRSRGITAIIVSHTATLERELHFAEAVEQHASTTIDKGGYLIFMNNHLPKQHFIL